MQRLPGDVYWHPHLPHRGGRAQSHAQSSEAGVTVMRTRTVRWLGWPDSAAPCPRCLHTQGLRACTPGRAEPRAAGGRPHLLHPAGQLLALPLLVTEPAPHSGPADPAPGPCHSPVAPAHGFEAVQELWYLIADQRLQLPVTHTVPIHDDTAGHVGVTAVPGPQGRCEGAGHGLAHTHHTPPTADTPAHRPRLTRPRPPPTADTRAHHRLPTVSPPQSGHTFH